MEKLVEDLLNFLKDWVATQPMLVSLLCGFFLVVLESIIPILPLAVFIAFNMILLGSAIGFILSWVGTICGCIISYFIFKKGLSKYLYKNIEKRPEVKKYVKAIRKMKFSNLVLLMAIPFTPAFCVNIAAGLTRMDLKKFITALLIGKLSIVYFWGFIGTTLVESIMDVGVLIKLGVILLLTFALSKVVLKSFNME